MTPRTRNIVVGIVVIAALVALAWMILQFSGATMSSIFNKGTAIEISADRADGVSEGSSILYLGVPVGRVTSVKRVANKSEVRIDALINAGETIPANVIGSIKAQSALSPAASIAFETEGPASEKVLQADDKVKAINRNAGLIPPEFSEIIRSMRDQQLVLHLDEMLIEARTQLKTAGAVMESFNKIVGDPKLKSDLASSIENIRATSESLNKFAVKLDALSAETTETMKQVRTTVADGGKRIDDLSKQIGDRLGQISDLMEKVNSIASRIDKGHGTLGSLVNDPRLYESMVDSSKELNLTVTDLRRLVSQWETEGFTLKLK